MQYGPRIVWGRGCPSTLSGAHVIEFNEDATEATCCQCALVIEGADLKRAFLSLPVEKRREMMAEAARRLVASGKSEDLWGNGE